MNRLMKEAKKRSNQKNVTGYFAFCITTNGWQKVTV